MRLLPAFVFIVILFLAGLFFLQVRRSGFFSGIPSGQARKAGHFIAATALVALIGILFTLLGKLVILIALTSFAVFFLSGKRGA